MPISQDRERVAEARLRDIARPDLYRRNPFRVVGLATNAKPAQVRAQRHLLLGAFDLGRIPGDRRLPLPEPPSALDVRQAFDALERPDHRLVDELFWWWGDTNGCGCAQEVHEEHDIAVETHAKALDELTNDDLWVDAADAWMDALDDPRFWDHVRHRIGVLNDRRMDESTVDGLRKVLPRVLLAPQVELASSRPKLAGLLDAWDVPDTLIDDAHRRAAESTCARIEALVTDVVTLLDNRSTPTALQRVAELPELAHLLEALAPHERYRWSARLRNRTAVVLNNCGLELQATDPRRSRALLEQALGFAVEQRDRDTILRNMEDLSLTTWEVQVIQQVRAGNRAEALRMLNRLKQQAGDPVQEARVQGMLDQLTGQQLRPSLWPLNLALFFLLVAVAIACTVGLFGAPTWVAVVVTIMLSWVPFRVMSASWYRNLFGRAASFFIGVGALFVAWNVIGELRPESFEQFLWCGGAFVVTSPFGYLASLLWTELRAR